MNIRQKVTARVQRKSIHNLLYPDSLRDGDATNP